MDVDPLELCLHARPMSIWDRVILEEADLIARGGDQAIPGPGRAMSRHTMVDEQIPDKFQPRETRTF